MEPSYIQPNQMNIAPLESAVAAALSAPNSQPEVNNSQASTQTAAVTSPHQQNPIYSTPSPVPTVVQGGSTSGFPKGWDPVTGLGMPPEFFTASPAAQFNASATQLMTPQQNALATLPTAQNSCNPQMAAQFSASAPCNASSAQDSFRNYDFEISSSGWSQLGVP